ncbi:MAG: excinuclease ABC subunit UvrC [SAR86 cluster bacterium]|nr:excinuclease ABC subunit UvrC [SAR86 cluster bacterium]
MKASIKEKVKSFPQKPGVYRFYDSNSLLYIGKAKNLRKRASSYFTKTIKEYKTAKLIDRIVDADFLITKNETEALLLEQNLIKSNQPRFNILLRDDKTFPYIEINEKHDFPQILFKRTTKASKELYGPFTSAKGTRLAISELQNIFKLRTCNDVFFSNRSRPCLQYQIGKCSAPCVDKISQSDYLEDINNTKKVLKGNFSEIIKDLKSSMKKFSNQQAFEKAGEIKTRIEMLRRIEETQIIFSGGDQTKVLGMATVENDVSFVVIDIEKNAFSNIKRYSFKNQLNKSNDDLFEEFLSRLILASPKIKEIISIKEHLGSPFFPHIKFTTPANGSKKKWCDMADRNAREFLGLKLQKANKYLLSIDYLKNKIGLTDNINIVGFDVSGGVGDIQTVSCVFFNEHGPDKSRYRFFNVPNKHSESDISALVYGIDKYLKNNFDISVVLIDGGKTHLNAIKTSIDLEKVKFVSLGKGEKRKYGIENLFYDNQKVEFRKDDSMSKLFLDVRDEAHRFAIKNFRSIKRKNLTKHYLQDLKGVGPKTIDKIYKEFGSIKILAKITAEQFSQKCGLSESMCKNIQRKVKEIYN